MENPGQPHNMYSPSAGSPPKNWLVESILVTIFCCLPLGIVGIINAANVNSRWAAGDFDGARRASEEAGRWTKIGFWLTLAFTVISIIAVIALGGLAAVLDRGGFE